jgi:putative DNA primase/helicase
MLYNQDAFLLAHSTINSTSKRSFVTNLLPNGRAEGNEWVALNPRRNDSNLGSFKINIATGYWADFATGETGGDLISLYAYAKGLTQYHAACEIANVTPRTKQQAASSSYMTDIDVEYHNKQFNTTPTAYYRYTNNKDETVGYIVRWDIEKDGKSSKETRPYFYDGKKWASKAFASPHPIYNLFEIVSRPNATVLIVEGEKTVDAAKLLFTDYVVVTSCGGAQRASKTDWSSLENRNIIIAADNDEAGATYANKVTKICTKFSNSIKLLDVGLFSKFAVKDSNLIEADRTLPQGWDLADAVTDGWTEELLQEAMIKSGKTCLDTPTITIAKEKPKDEIIELNGQNYKLTEETLFIEKKVAVQEEESGETKKPKIEWSPLCGYIKPTYYTRDKDSNAWGIILEIKDRDLRKKEIFIKTEELAADKEILKLLLEKGLKIYDITSKKDCNLIINYINLSDPKLRAIGVDTVGWNDETYILPLTKDKRNSYTVTRDDDPQQVKEEYIFQSNSNNARQLVKKGTLADWQDKIGKYLSKNPLLIFSVATAIASTIFGKLEEDGGCIHFSGSSSIGKSTTLHIASSIWGSKPSSLRTTDNAAESLCKNSNDGLLLLDELAEIDPASLEKLTYMFGNGTGKSRAKKNGESQTVSTFRVLGLSTGEIGLAAKLGEKNKTTTAGQSVRFIEIAAQSDKGLGVFDDIHGFESAREFADYLKSQSAKNSGVVIDEWLKYLVSDFDNTISFLEKSVKDWINKYSPKNADAQVARVARKFAIIAAVGELANARKILNLELGEYTQASLTLFNRWLDARGNTNCSHELTAMIDRIKKLTQEEQNARFLDSKGGDGEKTISKGLAGYKESKDGEIIEFWIHTTVFKREILENRNEKIFLRELAEAGYILKDSNGQNTQAQKAFNVKKARYFVIPASKLSSEDIE